MNAEIEPWMREAAMEIMGLPSFVVDAGGRYRQMLTSDRLSSIIAESYARRDVNQQSQEWLDAADAAGGVTSNTSRSTPAGCEEVARNYIRHLESIVSHTPKTCGDVELLTVQFDQKWIRHELQAARNALAATKTPNQQET